MQLQEEMDWRAVQSLCHRRLLALHQHPLDGVGTLRSLRWAVDLLKLLNASLDDPSVSDGSTLPLCETLARKASIVLPGGNLKRKSALHEDPSTHKKARQGACVLAVCRTATRIEARLAVPHIYVLTKFVCQCLLVSLDQPPVTCEADGEIHHPNTGGGSVGVTDAPYDLGCGLDYMDRRDMAVDAAGSGMWLYKWLVKALLWVPAKNAKSVTDFHVAAMDWLVAYLTIADPAGVIKVVLEDLASELCDREVRDPTILAIYMRRISIVEFAAIRMPEQLLTVLSSSFHVSDGMLGEKACSRFEELRSTDCLSSYFPSIWLVLASISRCFLSALTQLWVPCDKSAAETWAALLGRCDTAGTTFPRISEVFEGLDCEGVQGARSWLCALVKARLVELTPLAADIVVLLYSTAQSLTKEMDDKLAELSCELLEVILGQLTRSLLPECLGSRSLRLRGPLPELDGAVSFMDNLKQNVHRLWNAILDSSSLCFCTSCDGVIGDFFMMIDPSRVLCLCHSMEGASTRLAENWFNQSSWRKAEAVFSGLCHLVIMCSEDDVVTDILVQATAIKFREAGNIEVRSIKQVYTLMNVIKVLVAQASMQHVLKAWAKKLSQVVQASSNEQVLSMMAVLKVLLIPATWQTHALASKLITGRSSPNGDDACGLAWKSAWQLVRQVLDCEWRILITMLNRHHAWDMKWSVLSVLQLLPPDIEAQSQGVMLRLRSAIRVFFSLLQGPDGNQWRNMSGAQWWWHYVRIIEQLKEIIVDHATLRFSCFVLMVDNMLDFSFVVSGLEHKVTAILTQQRETSKPLPFNAQVLHSELSTGSSAVRAIISGNRSAQSDQIKIQRHVVRSHITRQEASRMTPMVANELGSLLRRATEKGIDQARRLHPCDSWTSHPASILATIIMSRLETPHEMPITMEQYEEVLPRHVSSPRHTYLVECFNNNTLLFEILQLIFEHGGRRETSQCAELVRTLLADCITRFHSTFRPRHPSCAAVVEGAGVEVLARMQVSRLIQVVWLSGWLPESLACSKEIVHAIDGAFIPDLLLLVWRCMHDGLAACAKAGAKACISFQTDGVQSFGGSRVAPTQLASTVAENSGRRVASSQAWEDSFQSILRHNIVEVSAHLAHIYPGRG